MHTLILPYSLSFLSLSQWKLKQKKKNKKNKKYFRRGKINDLPHNQYIHNDHMLTWTSTRVTINGTNIPCRERIPLYMYTFTHMWTTMLCPYRIVAHVYKPGNAVLYSLSQGKLIFLLLQTNCAYCICCCCYCCCCYNCCFCYCTAHDIYIYIVYWMLYKEARVQQYQFKLFDRCSRWHTLRGLCALTFVVFNQKKKIN